MAKSYWEKLKDPRWQKRRLEMLEKAGWKCERCGSSDETLHVHHGYYAKDKDPWEYGDDHLHVLCDECHSDTHHVLNNVKLMLGLLDFNGIERVFGYIAGLIPTYGSGDYCIRPTTRDAATGFADAIGADCKRVQEAFDPWGCGEADMRSILDVIREMRFHSSSAKEIDEGKDSLQK